MGCAVEQPRLPALVPQRRLIMCWEVRAGRRLLVTAGVLAIPLLAACSTTVSEPPATGQSANVASARPDTTMPSDHTRELSKELLPQPAALGSQWRYRVDAGSSEGGYQGNGTPAMARDPQEVVAALTPLGCKPVQLPVPTSALEVTYGDAKGTPAVGLLLEFADDDVATSFFDRRADVMRDCAAATSSQADVDVLRDEPASFISVRNEHVGETPIWTEGVQQTGGRVLFVAVAGAGATATEVVTSALQSS